MRSENERLDECRRSVGRFAVRCANTRNELRKENEKSTFYVQVRCTTKKLDEKKNTTPSAAAQIFLGFSAAQTTSVRPVLCTDACVHNSK